MRSSLCSYWVGVEKAEPLVKAAVFGLQISLSCSAFASGALCEDTNAPYDAAGPWRLRLRHLTLESAWHCNIHGIRHSQAYPSGEEALSVAARDESSTSRKISTHRGLPTRCSPTGATNAASCIVLQLASSLP